MRLTPAPVGQRLCRSETASAFQKWRDNGKGVWSAPPLPLSHTVRPSAARPQEKRFTTIEAHIKENMLAGSWLSSQLGSFRMIAGYRNQGNTALNNKVMQAVLFSHRLHTQKTGFAFHNTDSRRVSYGQI